MLASRDTRRDRETKVFKPFFLLQPLPVPKLLFFESLLALGNILDFVAFGDLKKSVNENSELQITTIGLSAFLSKINFRQL